MRRRSAIPRVASIGACAAAISCLFSISVHLASAQVVVQPQAAPTTAAAPATGQPTPQVPAGADGKPPQERPADGKPPDGKPPDGKPPEAKPGETKPAEPAVTPRPSKPAAPPDPDELKVRPGEDGKIRFSFKGQPWSEVLEWVATISQMSLDWQELPGDFLNLSTQQAYTVEEVRDLVNRHLLARGFTMLRQGEVLTVVNVKKLDPGLVPRVSTAELATRSPNEFVKVSFTLDWMLAETAAEELKPMCSPNGRLTALKSTNRLEAIDAVGNLREIYALLKEEQSHAGQERLVREFVLEHARAAEVEQHLNTLLGIEDKSKKGRPPTPEEMQQQQMQMQMQQEMRQRGQAPPPADKPKAQSVNLVVNTRKNAIVAVAPPDKMAIIEQAVKVLDVQNEGAQQLLSNMNRMQVYRLAAIDPEPLVTTLNDLGVLDPSTRLQVDKKNRSIIAYAALADHVTIRALVGKLDGSGRRFEVIQLHRLEADHVAGSIDFMINGTEKETTQPRRMYYDFGYYGGRNQQEDTSKDKFRVDADVEHNRLLVWANQVELDEVKNLLAKLGEIPARGGNNSTVRVLQIEPGKTAREALEHLKRAWPQLSPNPLVEPTADEPRDDRPQEPTLRRGADDRRSPDLPRQKQKEAPAKSDSEARAADRSVPPGAPTIRQVAQPAASVVAAPREQLAQAEIEVPGAADERTGGDGRETAADDADGTDVAPPAFDRPRRPNAAGAAARDRAPPITVTEGPHGELIVSSPDTDALDLFEEVLSQFAPQRRDYEVFYLKHAGASWVSIKLEDYFEVEDKKKTGRNNRMDSYFFGYLPQSEKGDATKRLSRRRNLKFIVDSDTNTILAQGADPAQLKLIGELIELYDQPEPVNSKAARVTVSFTLKYSKARIVGDAVKDVFRDLLSSNDKALQGAEQQQQKSKRPESQNVYITNLGGESEGDEKRTQVNFKGKLSIGVDELSNSLLVSTEGENLMKSVSRIIETLDEAAKPGLATVRVVQLGKYLDSPEVRQALARALGDAKRQSPPPVEEPDGQNPPPDRRVKKQPGQQGNRAVGNGGVVVPNNANGY